MTASPEPIANETTAASNIISDVIEAPYAAAVAGVRANGKAKAAAKPAKGKAKWTAATADPYVLYQLSVQDAGHETRFVDKVFKKLRGRSAVTLREDFCGTALVCAEWVRMGKDRVATGVDLDPTPLAWGREHNIAPLGKDAARVHLRQENVLNIREGGFDLAIAFNFSYWIFTTRADMVAYYRAVRQSLGPDGVFVLDSYGGWEAQQELEEPRKIDAGFTYVWHQAEFNPVDNSALNYIHFRFKDGTSLEKAFSYRWRLWQLVDIQEMLVEAGFADARVYWEDEDKDGDGTGVYRPQLKARNDPGWLAYVVARV
jgi:SAM-dependent methyltransferase